MMFDLLFESQEDPLFIEATWFNSERSHLAQSFDYNYGDFIPLLWPFLREYLNKCKTCRVRGWFSLTTILLRIEGKKLFFILKTCQHLHMRVLFIFYFWLFNILTRTLAYILENSNLHFLVFLQENHGCQWREAQDKLCNDHIIDAQMKGEITEENVI